MVFFKNIFPFIAFFFSDKDIIDKVELFKLEIMKEYISIIAVTCHFW